MAFRWNFTIFLVVMFTFNITEFECSKSSKKTNGIKNRTLNTAPAMLSITDFPLGISEVFDDASDVFRKIIGKMVANKKLVGLESGWYW